MLKKFLVIITIILLYCVDSRGYLIDPMDSIYPFSTGEDNNVTWTLSKATGKIGDCVKIDYTFEGGRWLQIYKNYDYISLAGGDVIKFYFKGTGNANTIEFYLEDINNNSKTLYFNRESNTPDWTEKVIGLSNFNNLNLSKIIKMKFAVSRQTGDDGGSGSLFIDKVELYQSISGAFAKSNIIDNFDGPDSDYTNMLGGVNGYWSKTSSSVIATNFSSNYCTLKFNYYSTNDDACDWYFKLEGTDYTNMSQFQYLRFKIKGKNGGEVIGIGLKDLDNIEKYVMLSDYIPDGTLTTNFKEVLIPLSSFDVDISRLNEVQFWFREDKAEMDIPDPGTNVIIYIDDLMFYSPRYDGLIKTIDDMDLALNYSVWDSYYDSAGSSINVTLVEGYDGKCYKIDYNLGAGNWVTIERNFYLNLFEGGGIKFYFKGEGDSNNLEIKLEDSDGTTYWRKYYIITDTDNVWKEIAFGFDELSFFSSGDDDNLDLKKIKTIYFAISQYGTGAQGSVYIDELRCESPTSYQSEFGADKIFKQIEVDNIPFSPNNDGYKDTVSIKFTLNKRAMVSLRIYNLAGNIIKEFTAEEYLPLVEHSFEWDGKDQDNKVVRNGIYFFQLKAQTYEGEIERVNYGIAVVK